MGFKKLSEISDKKIKNKTAANAETVAAMVFGMILEIAITSSEIENNPNNLNPAHTSTASAKVMLNGVNSNNSAEYSGILIFFMTRKRSTAIRSEKVKAIVNIKQKTIDEITLEMTVLFVFPYAEISCSIPLSRSLVKLDERPKISRIIHKSDEKS